MDTPYDLIIIGAGSAGISAAEAAAVIAKKVAIVSENIGGECLYTGCVPSKALIHAANEAYITKRHATIDPIAFYLEAKKKVEKAIKTIEHDHDNPDFFRKLGLDVFLGKANFIDAHSIKIGSKTLHAKNFLIATGSLPRVPKIDGLDTIDYLTNETIFSLESLPKSMAILGGGPIGCEMAQAFHRLGTTVTIFQHGDRLLPKDEPAASKVILDVFQREGITTLFHTEVTKVQKTDGAATITYRQADQEKMMAAEILFVAIGRIPNIKNLGLDRIGVVTDKAGVTINRKLQSSLSHIYVAGDCAGSYQFTHFAATQAVAAVWNIFLPVKLRFKPPVVPWATFTEPEVGHVGLTEAEAIAKSIKYTLITFPYKNIDRAVADERTDGFIQLITARQKIIGAQIVGERAGDIMQELAIAVARKLPASQLLSVMHVYPTYALGIQQALLQHFRQSNPWQLKLLNQLTRLT